MKILILQNKLLHYRIPVFNLLNTREDFEVTLAHPEVPASENEINFRQIIMPVVQKGPFVLHKDLVKLCNQYDVVIAMFDLKWLTYMKLALIRLRKFKLIFWGIGVSTEKGFDVEHKFDFIRFFLARKADGLLFYSEKAKEKYLAAKFSTEKVFVAHNSVESFNGSSTSTSRRDSFVFLGSLNKRKGVEELLEAFKMALPETTANLIIVGEGNERREIEQTVKRYHMEDRVSLVGHISDLGSLKALFDKAIACISPGQAGLSVLRSFSFGVPFICRSDAITGGERFDVKSNYNGYQYSGGSQVLAELLIKLGQNPKQSRQLGINAERFFQTSRTLNHMVDGFADAINSVR